MPWLLEVTWGHFSMKMLSYQCRNSHYEYEMVLWLTVLSLKWESLYLEKWSVYGNGAPATPPYGVLAPVMNHGTVFFYNQMGRVIHEDGMACIMSVLKNDRKNVSMIFFPEQMKQLNS